VASHPRSAAVNFFAPEWFWVLNEVREMPEALCPTHDSQVVNLVAIRPLR